MFLRRVFRRRIFSELFSTSFPRFGQLIFVWKGTRGAQLPCFFLKNDFFEKKYHVGKIRKFSTTSKFHDISPANPCDMDQDYISKCYEPFGNAYDTDTCPATCADLRSGTCQNFTGSCDHYMCVCRDTGYVIGDDTTKCVREEASILGFLLTLNDDSVYFLC